jgi:hypothetical protein
VLELGYDAGASVGMWCGYLPAATLHWVDLGLDPRCAPCRVAPGAYAWHADGGDAAALRAVVAQAAGGDGGGDGGGSAGGGGNAAALEAAFDLVVDDASHLPAHQLEAFNGLFADDAVLRPGGLWIIEVG